MSDFGESLQVAVTFLGTICRCPENESGHCDCWWDDAPCCNCGEQTESPAPAQGTLSHRVEPGTGEE